MSHSDYQEQVSLYVDGILDDKASASLFAHLSECVKCRLLLKVSMRVREHVAERNLEMTPLSLDRRILGSIPSLEKNSSPWYAPVWFTRISVPLPAAASIVFLIIVGCLLFSPLLAQGQKQETEVPAPFVDKIPPELRTPFNPNR
jgi:anti-sigma factor RsiW